MRILSVGFDNHKNGCWVFNYLESRRFKNMRNKGVNSSRSCLRNFAHVSGYTLRDLFVRMICEIILTGRSCIGLMLLFCITGYLLILGILSEITVNHSTDIVYPAKHSIKTNWEPPGKEIDHLHVFVQISDLHLSAFQKERGNDLLHFCSKTLGVIQPEVVMLTGDITDAKLENLEGSKQILDEWIDYKDILDKSNILNRTVWLDTRGNHDAFDVPHLDSKDNLFRKFSVQGQTGKLSYHYKHRSTDGDVTSFIAVDACLDPGPKRPFNFFGMLKDSEITRLKEFIEDSSSNSNATIFFGHYPSSVISNHNAAVVRNLFSTGIAYLCGHFHTFAGLVTQMYAFQREGYLELELGDWKHERLYRVMALDNGLFSFVDIPTQKSPVILITNPKDERFMVWGKEPIHNIEESSHIRILIFSPHAIRSVLVSIDNSPLGEAEHLKDSLFILPWEAKKYNTGFHHIEVSATDSSGKTSKVKQGFSMDGSHSGFTFIQRFILMMDHTFFFKSFFALTFAMAVFPLVFFKIFKVQIIALTQHRFSNCFLRFFQRWMRRFCLVANRPKLFYPLLAYNIYLVSGPWFVGYILSDHIGACFLYGLLVDGHFLQTSLTYLYGALQMLQFNIPLTFYLAFSLDCTMTKQISGQERCGVCFNGWNGRWFLKPVKHVIDHLFFFFIILFQAYLILSGFLKSYGFLAFLICPMRTWAIVLALVLHFMTVRSKHSLPQIPDNKLDHSFLNKAFPDESFDNESNGNRFCNTDETNEKFIEDKVANRDASLHRKTGSACSDKKEQNTL